MEIATAIPPPQLARHVWRVREHGRRCRCINYTRAAAAHQNSARREVSQIQNKRARERDLMAMVKSVRVPWHLQQQPIKIRA
jgi:hypothetical protein